MGRDDSPVPPSTARSGALFAIGAYGIWGAVPLYFKALKHVAAPEIIGHRVLWAVLFIALLLAVRDRFAGFFVLVRRPRVLAMLVASTLLITANWLIFVWSVNANRVLETSLGYFITPLVNMLLGFIFLGERLRPAQRLAVAFAALGVLNQLWHLGVAPWIPLSLALTFGAYGLVRKQLALDALNGLFIETLLAAPLAAGYLLWLQGHGAMAFGQGDRFTDWMLAAGGPITAIPLMLFAAGARRLSLSTLGFLQYIAPTMTFLLAVFVYGEPLGAGQLLTFGLIWFGLAIYTFDLWRLMRRLAPAR